MSTRAPALLSFLLLPLLLLSHVHAAFVELNREIARSYANDALFVTDSTDVLSDVNWLQSYRRSGDDSSTSATNGGFPVVRCAEVSSEDCSGTTATIVVVISKCLSDSTIAKIRDWLAATIKQSAANAKLTLRKGDVNAELRFEIVLHNTLCVSFLENFYGTSAARRLRDFDALGSLRDDLPSQYSKPTAVVAFFKDDNAYAKVQDYERGWKLPFAYNFQVNEATGGSAAKTNAIYLNKIADLGSYSPFVAGLSTRFSCAAQLPNGDPFTFYDAVTGDAQCVCTCPKGYEITRDAKTGKLSCKQLSNPAPIDTSCSECVWDSFGPLKFEVTDELAVCSLAELLTTSGLPVPRLMSASVADGKSAEDASRQLTLSATPLGVSSVYDGDKVADALFALQGLAGKCDRDSVLAKRPLRMPSWSSYLQPKSVSAPSLASSKKSCGWSSYQKDPQKYFNQLTIAGYGKYKLTATAADGTRTESCSGCLAIVDKNRPRATTKCPAAFCGGAASTSSSLPFSEFNAELNNANLCKANASVQQVFAFQDKAANDACSSSVTNRCDEQLFEVRDFFADKFAAGKTFAQGRECFSPASVWSEFLASPATTQDVFAATTAASSALLLQADAPVAPGKCMRCCRLDVKLKEKWIDYLCDSNYDTERCSGLESETCAYTQCLTFMGGSVATATVQIRAAVKTESENVLQQLKGAELLFQSKTQVHRALSCTRFGETADDSCSFRAKISSLVETSAAFHADWLGYGTGGKDPSKFVFWRYKVAGESGGSKWRLLNANAPEHVFTQSETQISLEAWSQCGLVGAFAFSVHLHVHNAVQVCERFDDMWFQTFAAPLTEQSALCNLPKSDFVELTFNYQPSLGVQYAGVALPMSISRLVCIASVSGRPGAEILRVEGAASFDIARQFAIQLQDTPTTAATTDLRLQCTFTYAKYDKTTTALACSKSFTLKDCDKPCITASTQTGTCNPDVCAAKALPGLYEACATSVLTASATQTQIRAQGSECCQACSVPTTCTPLLTAPDGKNVFGLSRCEPVVGASPSVYGAVANASAYAALLLSRATSSVSAALGGALGFLGAVVAAAAVAVLVVVSRSRRQKQLLMAEDDVYVLMER